jgi:hypothetical protein
VSLVSIECPKENRSRSLLSGKSIINVSEFFQFVVAEEILMKKDRLTVLGCSGSLAVTLLTGHPARANALESSVREYIFTAPAADVREAVRSENSASDRAENCGCRADNPLETDFTDEEGEQAIAQLGCDCAGCRYIIRSQAE